MKSVGLAGQTAVVTGAGTGVGQALAVALADEGCRVALIGRREARLRETEAAIQAGGRSCKVYVADVSDPEQIEPVLASIRSELGDITILVNNAGVHGEFAPISRSDPRRWRETLLVNLYAPYLLCRLCLPAMIEKGWGRVINVSSAAGLSEPHSINSIYPLSKYSLNYFSRQVADELKETEVSCTAIHPGEVKTEMWAAIKSDVESRGPEAEGMRGWAEGVERTGGDPPQKAIELVLRILRSDASEVNGKFMRIESEIFR